MRVSACWALALLWIASLSTSAPAGTIETGTPSKVAPYDVGKTAKAARITDPDLATQAYLESIPAERRERTKGYAVGNYVIRVATPLYLGLLMALILVSGLSAKMRNLAVRFTRFPFLQAGVYALLFVSLLWALLFPLSYYASFVHEKRYGLLDKQDFSGWLIDEFKGLAVLLVFGAVLLMVLYAVLRRAPRTWWLWGWAVVMCFAILGMAIAPVYLTPLFNKFTPLPESELRERILAEAREQGVPARDVYKMDMSRRSDRIGAYVAGMLGTTRIVLFDTLLERCTQQEILFVMGHEMGHYVLNHVWKGAAAAAIILLFGFLFLRWGFARVALRWPRASITGVGDPAGLPVLVLLFAMFSLVATPVVNTLIRVEEAQADEFGLNASRLPDAAARDFLMLGEYRDLDPSPVIEFVFFDHPSGRNRIHNAMLWKQAHHNDGQSATKDEGRRGS